jgi:hypothetical protein
MEAEAVVAEAGSPAAMDTAITTTTTNTTATTAVTSSPFTTPAKVPIAGKICISHSLESQLIISLFAITQKSVYYIQIMF